jgi:hypothetical protein
MTYDEYVVLYQRCWGEHMHSQPEADMRPGGVDEATIEWLTKWAERHEVSLEEWQRRWLGRKLLIDDKGWSHCEEHDRARPCLPCRIEGKEVGGE